MLPDSTRQSGDANAAQQRFLSLFLSSEREIFRYVAVLVPNVTDAEDIVQQTADEFELFGRALTDIEVRELHEKNKPD